jgi:hypothetical protein
MSIGAIIATQDVERLRVDIYWHDRPSTGTVDA